MNLRTHCKKGLHELIGENVCIYSNGQRICRPCKREAVKQWRLENYERYLSNVRRYRNAHRDRLNACDRKRLRTQSESEKQSRFARRKESYLANREKRLIWAKAQYRKNPGRSYGLSAEQYWGMVRAHDGKCAICKKSQKLHIDHDKKTGNVRGLLCGQCNRGIGLFYEEIEALKSAITYLESSHGR